MSKDITEEKARKPRRGFPQEQTKDPTRQSDNSDTTMATLSHILALLMGIVTGFGFIVPLIIYLTSDEEITKRNAANATNWQISLIIYVIISLFLALFFVGLIMMFVLLILNVVFCIKGAVKASDGEIYNYPLTIDFL
jgi:uncharacterized Tic20 family protein